MDRLRAVATNVREYGPSAWSFSLTNGSVMPMTGRLAEGWLELRASIPESVRADHDDLDWLRVNEQLAPVCVVRPLGSGTAFLKTDLWAEDDTPFAEDLPLACLAMQEALHRVREGHSPVTAKRVDAFRSAAEFERLCGEAGWSGRVMPQGHLSVDLPTRAGIFTAQLDPSGRPCGRLVVMLGDIGARSVASRQSIGRLLLALSAAVRSVAGVLTERDGSLAAALASPLRRDTVEEFDRTASALSAACQIAGREIDTLSDEQVAATYLQLTATRSRSDSRSKEENTCLSRP
jgi:hypothetical protein